ncbi:MAG: glutamine synthetase [Planctomycetota bacterium]|nr:MAG: glutamine synthetase [Planctomycetota bacterium]
MDRKDIQNVLEQAKENGVAFTKFWFTDILGFLKGFTITHHELENALEGGMGFDGSSIKGFARIDESDMIAMPDPDTFAVLPWRPKENAVARMFCDIMMPDGKPFEGDPRYVLKRQLDRAESMGYKFMVGPELEFFYFKSDKSPEVLDHGGYFDMIPRDEAIDLRRETILMLDKLGIMVEYAHHEVASSQHEIDLHYTEAFEMADNCMTYRLVVKEIAAKHGFYATFMPKPIFSENGSGMHVHMSLFKGDRNAFFDAKAPFHLSDTARHFTAGLMKHARAITAVTNQWVNSYKRLVPGYEAPVYISWATRNRSDLIRVPMYKPGHEKATRMEYRSPDPACNPYLAFAVLLAAGLEGIEKKYQLDEPVEENVYEMPEARRKELGIHTLPSSLIQAVYEAERSEFLREALGEHVWSNFISNKKIEWERFHMQVTQYEIDTYLPVL